MVFLELVTSGWLALQLTRLAWTGHQLRPGTATAGGRGQRVARIAERLLEEAGMSVVPSDPFYRRYDGATFAVSRWEGHPNEEALAIFAAMLAEDLRGRGLLEAARRVD